jgi:NifU-like protein
MIIDRVRGKQGKGPVGSEKPKKLTNIQKIQLVQKTISEQIRPLLKAHGGDIDLIDVDGNKVIVAFRGMCSQCPTAEFTMKDVVEARLHEFVSEDLIVEEQL